MLEREHWRLGLAAFLAAGLFAAGCGGGSSNDGPTRAEFITQADAICKKAHDKLDSDFNAAFSGKQPSQADLNKFALNTLVPAVQGEIDDVSALAPPSADKADVAAIIDAEQAGVNKIKADPGVLSPKVPENPLGKGQRLANDYGMKECST